MRDHRIRRAPRGEAAAPRGLERLEYRGYDSAGIALREEDGLDYVRAVGNLQNLKQRAGSNGSHSRHGLGHTRWATHGAVTERERAPARPAATTAKLAIVLNGIVENYRELKRVARRRRPHVHVRDRRRGRRAPRRAPLRGRPRRGRAARRTASSRATSRSSSSTSDHPTCSSARAARRRSSSASATARCSSPPRSPRSCARRAASSSSRTATSSRSRPTARVFHGRDGAIREVDEVEVDWDDESAEKGGYETFMLKEIYEQPEAVRETIGDRVRHGELVLESLGLTETELRNLRRIVIVACGTAYHAGVVGRYVLEEWARLPVEPDIASEWIYRNPVLSKDTLVIGISQSGETRDTVNAMKLAQSVGRAHARDHEPDGHADHARGRRRALHALRARGRRRRVEDVHRAGRAALPRRAQARAGARRRCRRTRSSSSSTSSTSCRRSSTQFLDGDHPSRRSRSASTTSRSSSTSAATSGCRSRSRAR